MRWVVELPAPSGGIAATVTVDADSWAGALTHARGGSPIKKFRCEFDADNVVRVLDLSTREWYTIKPFRAVGADATSQRPAMPAATAPETLAPQGGTLPPPAMAAAPVEPPAPVPVPVEPPAPVAVEPPQPAPAAVAESAPIVQSAAPTPEVAEPPAAPVEAPSVHVEEAPATTLPEVAPAAVVAAVAAAEAVSAAPTAVSGQNTLFGVPPPRGDESRLVPIAESSGPFAAVEPSVVPTLLFERDQDPGTTNPLTYRERVFAVPQETTPQEAEQVARHAFAALRRALATRPRGRYVVVAVFDHHFTSRPSRPALVELRWKDWRGEVEVTFPPAPPAPVNGVEAIAQPPTAAQPPPAAIVTTPDGAALAHAPPVAEAAPADVSGSVDASAVIAVAAVAAAPEAPRVEAPVEVSAAPVPPVSPTAFASQAEESSTIVVSAAVEPPPAESPASSVVVPEVAPVAPEPAVVVAPAAPEAVAEPAVVVAPEPAVVAEPAPAPAPVAEPTPPAEPAPAAVSEPAVVVAEPAPAAVSEPAVVVAEPAPAAAVVVAPAAPEAVAEPAVVAAPEPAAAAVEEQPAPVAEPTPAPAPAAEPAPAPAAEPTPAPAPAPAAEPAPAPAAEPTPAPVAQAPRGDAKSRVALAKRLRGKDLLSELFDSLMVLSHMQHADEAADFIAKLLHDSIHADVSAVSLYDIDKDEFVVVASHGADGLLGRREKATRGAPGQMLRRRHGVMIARCEADDAIVANTAGGGALFAPAYHRDRLFAMVRLHREQGSVDFETDELDATTYVAGQLGEFLATHSKRVGAAEFASDQRKPASTRRSIPPTKR